MSMLFVALFVPRRKTPEVKNGETCNLQKVNVAKAKSVFDEPTSLFFY